MNCYSIKFFFTIIGQIDLYQDVDAYNISRIYNLSSVKIHNAFNDYYNVSQKYKWRFSIFKQELLKEFETESIYDAVLPFTHKDKGLLSKGFGYAFGEFENEYAEVLAQGFAQRIELATFDDYLKNGDEKELEKVMSFLKGQKKGNDNLHTAEAARAGEALEGQMGIVLKLSAGKCL